MIKNLQGMQSKMQDMQNKLNNVTAEGESGRRSRKGYADWSVFGSGR